MAVCVVARFGSCCSFLFQPFSEAPIQATIQNNGRAHHEAYLFMVVMCKNTKKILFSIHLQDNNAHDIMIYLNANGCKVQNIHVKLSSSTGFICSVYTVLTRTDWCRAWITCITFDKWATSRENVSSGVFDQIRLKPACSATETS